MAQNVLYFTQPYQVAVRREAVPTPKADELLVKTAVSAVSAGTEMLLYRGQMPPGMAVDATIAALAGDVVYPLRYGYAAVGEVMAVGAAVDAAWNGRLIFSFQPHQSYFTVRPDEVQLVPAGMTAETAVFLPNMETAVSFVMDGQPIIGERVAVFGQGIVGLLTTSLLAQMPLAQLVTFDTYAQRRDWSQRRGADLSLDPRQSNLLAEFQGETAVDLCYELSGNPQALDQAIGVTGYGGRVVIGSWYGQKRHPVDLGGHFHRSHMRLISSQVSTLAPQWNGRWTKARRLHTAWGMLRQHDPTALITHRFPLAEAAAAYDLLDRAAETAVQLIFEY